MTTGKERRDDADWPTVTLGDCVEINYATYTPKEAWPFINYLDTKNIIDNRIAEIQRLIAGKDKFPTRARRKVQVGDIVYSTVRPNQKHFGIMKKVPENFLASTGFAVIKGKGGAVCTNFIYWFLAQDHIVERLHTVAEHSASAYPSIKPADIERLTLKLPSLSEQRAIAGVLSALDDKIELNRRMNETLEAMARAVFEDWFVRFGPTRARMEGCEPYLGTDLWSLFPDRIDGATGFPAGWSLAHLSDVAAPRNRDVDPEGVTEDTPYIGLEHMPRRSISLARWDTARKITSRKTRFEKGEFLFGKLNPHFHKVGIAPCNGICSTDILVIRPASEEWSAFVLACISAESFVDFADRTSSGTTMPRTSWKALSRYEIAMPPAALAAAYREVVGRMLERIVANTREAHTLATLRDVLLPRLISGEIGIDDAALRLGAVA